MAWADHYPCRAVPLGPEGGVFNLTLDSCGVMCDSDLPDRGQLNRTLRAAPRFSLRLADADAAHSDTFTYNLPSQRPAKQAPPGHGGPAALDARLMPGLGTPLSATAPASPRAYFPTPGLHTLACSVDNGTEALNCTMGRGRPTGRGEYIHASRAGGWLGSSSRGVLTAASI